MQYDIFWAGLDNKEVYQLPILPPELPDLQRGSNNEEFETFSDGNYNFIGAVGLLRFTLESWLPGKGKNYSFQRVKDINPDDYVQFIDRERLFKRPIRIIISRSDGSSVLNDTFSIESFNWHENRECDYVYSLSVKQWRAL